MSCFDINGNEIINFILNEDGTVVGTIEVIDLGGGTIELPIEKYNIVKSTTQTVSLTKECCESRNFIYNEFNGKCYWSLPCTSDNTYDIVLGSNQYDNSFFNYTSGETCVLKGKLDFLVNYDCNDLLACFVNNSGNTLTITEKNNDTILKLNKENETFKLLINELNDNNLNIEKKFLSEIVESSELIEKLENELDFLKEKKEFLINSDLDSDQIELVKVIKEIQNKELLINQNKTILNDVQFKQKIISTNQNEILTLENKLKDNQTIIDGLLKDNELGDNILTYSNLLECLNINLNIDVINYSVSGNTIDRVISENIYGFDNLLFFLNSLSENNLQSGILLNGNNCDLFINNILTELGDDCSLVDDSTFNSDWLSINFEIVDESLLELIRNKEIRISFTISNPCCCPFSLLIDNVELNKICETIDDNIELVKGCFGFELEKVIDNKKSWVNIENKHKRIHDLSLRETNYEINDYRLSINTKEVDLSLDMANAVEIDLFDYIKNNPCLLQCSNVDNLVSYVIDENYLSNIQDENLIDNLLDEESYQNLINLNNCNECVLISGYCGDIYLDLVNLISTDTSILERPEEIRLVILSELIDVKNRKILSEYPTIKALYERYLNSLKYCGVNSASYNIYDIENFSKLLGNYWVDLIEQFIPSTTIWDATHIYSNTLFDQDKFIYKKSSLQTCNVTNATNIIGFNLNVGVDIENITNSLDNSCIINNDINSCSGVFIYQYDNGSEFFGTIVDSGIPTSDNILNNDIISNSGNTSVVITSPLITEDYSEIN